MPRERRTAPGGAAGNVGLTLSNFIDSQCAPVSGGPGSTTLERASSTTYTCSRALTGFGPYSNSATVTGKRSPAGSGGSPITQTSNTVVVNVPPEPGFSITKYQEIAGSNAGFTTSPLLGEVAQTVNYEIVVTNTGNVPLAFGELSDAKCESVTGGPGVALIEPNGSTTYFCQHLLTEAKAYSNTAQLTGTPPPGDGPPVTNTSNPVVVVTNPSEKGTEENEHVVVTATCSYVTVNYRNFPNLPNNTVTQTLTIHGVTISKTKFTFNGPTGSNTIPIVVPPGSGFVDIHASWSTNGSVGHFDVGVSLECPPEPDYTITKLQQIEGTNTGFTTAQLTG
jgi:hypothetical protein